MFPDYGCHVTSHLKLLPPCFFPSDVYTLKLRRNKPSLPQAVFCQGFLSQLIESNMLFDITALQPGAQSTLQIPPLHPASTEAPQFRVGEMHGFPQANCQSLFILFLKVKLHLAMLA